MAEKCLVLKFRQTKQQMCLFEMCQSGLKIKRVSGWLWQTEIGKVVSYKTQCAPVHPPPAPPSATAAAALSPVSCWRMLPRRQIWCNVNASAPTRRRQTARHGAGWQPRGDACISSSLLLVSGGQPWNLHRGDLGERFGRVMPRKSRPTSRRRRGWWKRASSRSSSGRGCCWWTRVCPPPPPPPPPHPYQL